MKYLSERREGVRISKSSLNFEGEGGRKNSITFQGWGGGSENFKKSEGEGVSRKNQ